MTFSANQKSVKPSKIAIFQVQMQSKNWWNNQIRSKKRFWQLILCHPIPFLRVSCLKIGPNWPNRQYCFAGSSYTAPRILIFSIAMGTDYSFYVKSIATYALTFLKYNNSFSAIVLHTAIPYRVITGWKQGFSCEVFPHRESPVFITGMGLQCPFITIFF